MDTSPPQSTISNFRDVAHTLNSPTNTTLKPSLLYRSALPSTSTPSAQARLTTTYGIKTILDLRTDTEILEHQKAPSNAPSPLLLQQKTQSTAPTTRTTAHISLNGPAYTRALLKRLSYTQTAQLGVLYLLTYRTQAISILGRNVLSKRGLSGLAIDTLTHSTAEIARVFALLADPASYPVLVHCTQGKDRTGLVCLLAGLLCGASEEALRRDYERSAVELEPEREARVLDVARIGLPASFVGCEDGLVGVVCAWLKEEWGGVEGYLGRACGVGEDVVDGVRRILGAQVGERVHL
ncbi:hypothetical protein Q7P37_002755 [Cladosporium fusiforme]